MCTVSASYCRRYYIEIHRFSSVTYQQWVRWYFGKAVHPDAKADPMILRHPYKGKFHRNYARINKQPVNIRLENIAHITEINFLMQETMMQNQ